MSITPSQVLSAFQVTGSNPNDLDYTRFLTTELAQLPLIVSNSSTTFGIRFFPTGSAGLSFTTETGQTVDSISQVTLPVVSGSNVTGIKLLMSIDTANFNDTLLTSQSYDIGFSVVAITASAQLPSDAPSNIPCTPEGEVAILYPCCAGLEPVNTPPTGLPVCTTP
jgi:hypothetical protein